MARIVNVCARGVLGAGLVMATAVGCSSERSTQPAAIPKLAATPISLELVTDTSAAIAPMALADSSQQFDFGSSESFTAGGVSDIYVTCEVDLLTSPEALLVYDPRSGQWLDLAGALPPTKFTICGLSCRSHTKRLLSQCSRYRPEHFLDTEGRVNVLAPGADHFVGRLISYSPNYQHRVLRVEDFWLHASMAWSRGALYVYADYHAPFPGNTADTMASYDLEGNRRWAAGTLLSFASQSAFDGEAYWVLDYDDDMLNRLDTSGQVIEAIGWTHGWIESMTWARGTLWFARHEYANGSPLLEMELDSSRDRGSVVVRSHGFLPVSDVRAMTHDDSTLLFVSGSTLYRCSFEGTVLDEISMPVVRTDAVAWDGESLWALHHGPAMARTDATLLTRFTLE